MLKLHTFGNVYVTRDGVALDGAAGQRRVLALLAVLATAGEAGVSRDRLLGLLWPESSSERARHALTQALYNARRALGDDNLFVAGNDVRLDSRCLVTDVGEFLSAIERSDDLAAVEAYQGPFLDGFYITGVPEFEQWAALHRARFSADVAGALDRLAASAESRGEIDAGIEMRRRRVTLDPLDPAALLALMTALAGGGDVLGALRHARVYEALLRQQLDLEPDPRVARLANELQQAPLVGKVGSVAPGSVTGTGSPPASHFVESSAPLPPPRVAPAPTGVLSRRRRLRAIPMVGLAGTLIGAVAVLLVTIVRGQPGATPAAAAALGVSPVMVAPFRVAGADPSLAYLREGIVELLSARRADDPARPAVDPGVVLSRWQGAGVNDERELSQAEVARIASRLGARTAVIGNVVGNQTSVLITASLVDVSNGVARASETVRGPVDSVLALVDQLAFRLLAADAGEGERLRGDRTPPLRSLRAYLTGQAAYRQGRFADAVSAYERALDVDSTFALAAFRLSMAADRLNAAEQHDWALAVAWRHRDALSKRDQAHLIAFAGPRYPAPSSEAEQLAAWERATVMASDRAEVWQELGERFFYDGPVMGAPDWSERSVSAFRRALVLDPAAAMARAHLILIAARTSDSAALQRLASPAALTDSVGELAPFLTWRVAIARNDSSALRSVRDRFPEHDVTNLRWIAMSSLFDAVGAQDGERALRIRRLRSRRAVDELDVLLAQHSFALNQGRPVMALDITEQLQEVQPGTRAHLRLRVLDALYADGDARAAEHAVAELTGFAAATPIGVGGEAVQLADLCVVEQWRLARGDRSHTRRVIARLRAATPLLVTVPVATPPLVCAEILEASSAVVAREPNAHAKVQRLDSLMLTGPAVSDAASYAHLVVAGLYERLGEPRRALDAIRRRGYMSGWPRYLATARRTEGRLALLAGDTSAAAGVYRRYLALRHEAEPLAARLDEPIERFVVGLSGRGPRAQHD